MAELLVCDPISSGDSHYFFNKSFLKGVIESRSYNNVYYVGSTNYLEAPNISYKISKSYKDIFKNIIGVINNKNIDKLIFLASDNFFIPLLSKLINNFKDLEISIILHNNFQNLNNNFLKKNIWRSVDRGRNLSLICLTDNIVNDNDLELKNIKYVPHHTYLNLQEFRSLQEFETKVYDFSFLGRHASISVETGFISCFIDILNDIATDQHSNIDIFISEKFEHDVDHQNLSVTFDDGWLSKEVYLDNINKSRFLVFPYHSISRKTASGILNEAITLGIPVIAPEGGTFPSETPSILAEYLYSDKSHLGQILVEVLSMNEADYLRLSDNLKKEAQNRCISNLLNRY